MGRLNEALFFWLGLLDFSIVAVVLAPLAISVAYYLSTRGQSKWRRSRKSVHGLLFVLALGYAALVSPTAVRIVPAWHWYPFAALLLLGLASVLYSLTGPRRRLYLHALHVFTLSYGAIIAYRGALALESTLTEAECWLPQIVFSVPTQTPLLMGDRDDRRRSLSCPVPMPRVVRAIRPYGTLEFEVWGSPHRLYMSGTGANGTALAFAGDDVRPYVDSAGSWLSKYSHERRFQGEDFGGPVPDAPFEIAILDPDGATLEQLSLTYRTQQCQCLVAYGPPR